MTVFRAILNFSKLEQARFKRLLYCWFRLFLFSLVTLLGACSSAPVEFTDSEVAERAKQTLEELFGNYPEVKHDVTMGEAMARALLFNLEDRIQLLNIAVEEKAENIENLNLLPELTLEAGYKNRSEELASFNKNTVTGTRSTQPIISTEDESPSASLDLAWNILDFGVSYVSAQQQQDRIFIAKARRQQVMQNVLIDVRSAFWRAYAAQKWAAPIEQLMRDLEVVSERLRLAAKSGAITKEEALRVQSDLLETVGDLLAIKKQLVGAKNELASLMNLRPGEDFTLILSAAELAQYEAVVKAVDADAERRAEQLARLEERALAQRPELSIADYNVRLMRRDVKRLMLSMLPGVDLSLKEAYDGDDFKLYDQYTRLGLNVGYNLFNLMKWPAHKRQAENRVLLEEEKRKALAMAVLTQVHVGWAQQQLARNQLAYADRLARIDKEILDEARSQLAAGTATRREVLQNNLNYIESGLSRDWMYAGRKMSSDQLFTAVGVSLAQSFPRQLVQQEDLELKLTEISKMLADRSDKLANFELVMREYADQGRVIVDSEQETPDVPQEASVKDKSSETLESVEQIESVKKQQDSEPNKKPQRVASQSESVSKLPSTVLSTQQTELNAQKAEVQSSVTDSVSNVVTRTLSQSSVRKELTLRSTQFEEAKQWCVYLGYFSKQSSAVLFANQLRNKIGQDIDSIFTGAGYRVYSGPLSYKEAYQFRSAARSSSSKDAYIRSCPK